MPEASRGRSAAEAALAIANRVLNAGVDGVGPMKDAAQVAQEHAGRYRDREQAEDALIRTHVRLSTATGFATGVGGVAALPVAIPTDVTTFYVLAARCAAGVADPRGWDVESDEVRSVVPTRQALKQRKVGTMDVDFAADFEATSRGLRRIRCGPHHICDRQLGARSPALAAQATRRPANRSECVLTRGGS